MAQHGPARPPTHPLLHAFQYDADSVDEWRPQSLAEIHPRVRPGSVLWANVNDTRDPSVLHTLASQFNIHPLTLEDLQNTHQRPKVEEYPDYLFVVGRMLKLHEDGEMDTEQVSILMGEGWLVTIQEGKPGDAFEPVRERLRAGAPILRASGPDHLLYAILDAIVDSQFAVLEKFGTRAEELEDIVLERPQTDIRAKLQQLRRDLLVIRRLAWPQRDAIAQLERGELRWIRAPTRTFLRDVNDHAARVIDFVEVGRELVASLMELHRTNVAQRTNETMRLLTVVSTIFIPLTFVAGVYGMNFEHMPELRSPWGYPIVLGFMASVGATMYWAFHRRGWV